MLYQVLVLTWAEIFPFHGGAHNIVVFVEVVMFGDLAFWLFHQQLIVASPLGGTISKR